MSEQENAVAPAKVQLTVSGILADLQNGLTRAMIQNKYGLSGKDMKSLFSHPKLKGKKTIPAPAFVLVDDTTDAVEEDTPENDVEEVVDETLEAPTNEAENTVEETETF